MNESLERLTNEDPKLDLDELDLSALVHALRARILARKIVQLTIKPQVN